MVAIAAVQSEPTRVFGSADPHATIAGNIDDLETLIAAVGESGSLDVLVLAQGALQGIPGAGLGRAALAAGALTVDSAEVGRVASLAESLDSYVAFGLYERDTASDAVYSAGVVVGPDGFRLHYRQMTAPDHDALSRPSLGPDGDVASLFPCGQTPFGRIACIVGSDIDSYHVPKAHSLRGAELLLHVTATPPTWRREGREQALKAAGYEALCGVASASLADSMRADESTTGVYDWTGRSIANAGHCRRGYIVASLDLEDVRARRRRHSMNFVSQTRTDLYARGFALVAAAR